MRVSTGKYIPRQPRLSGACDRVCFCCCSCQLDSRLILDTPGQSVTPQRGSYSCSKNHGVQRPRVRSLRCVSTSRRPSRREAGPSQLILATLRRPRSSSRRARASRNHTRPTTRPHGRLQKMDRPHRQAHKNLRHPAPARRTPRPRSLPEPRRDPLPAPRRRLPARRRPRLQARESDPRHLPADQSRRPPLAEPRLVRPHAEPGPQEPRPLRHVQLHHHRPVHPADLRRGRFDGPLRLRPGGRLYRGPHHPGSDQHRSGGHSGLAERPGNAGPLPARARPVPRSRARDRGHGAHFCRDRLC